MYKVLITRLLTHDHYKNCNQKMGGVLARPL